MQEENTTSKSKSIILGAVAVILLVAIPATFYLYINSGKNKINIDLLSGVSKEKNEQTKLEKDSANIFTVTKNSTNNNIQSYLDNNSRLLDEMDSNNLNKYGTTTPRNDDEKWQRDILLLRKAIILGLNRDQRYEQNNAQATEIFINLINSNDHSTASSTYIRDFSIISLVRMHTECCNESLNSSEEFERINIDSKYNQYINKKYDKNTAKTLALINLNNSVSDKYKLDIQQNNNNYDLSASVISSNYNIDKEDKATILNGLKVSLANSNKLIPITRKDFNTTNLQFKGFFAYAFDYYNQATNKSISQDLNSLIDKNYSVISEFDESKINVTYDRMSIKDIKFYNNIRYIYSMHLRYGDKVNTQYINKIIDENISIINTSQEMKVMAENFFKSQDVQGGKFKSAQYFLTLSSLNKNLADYKKSIGL